MAKRKSKRNNEFLMLGVVAVVIVVAIFAATIAGNKVSGYDTYSQYGAEITHDSTGLTMKCEWAANEGNWRWIGFYDDGTEVRVPRRVTAGSRGINCDPRPGFFECTDKNNLCNAHNEEGICVCRQQLTIHYPEEYKNTYSS